MIQKISAFIVKDRLMLRITERISHVQKQGNEYVVKHGEKLYKGNNEATIQDLIPSGGLPPFPTISQINKKAKKESLVGGYLKRHAGDITLSVNTNTLKYQTKEEALYLQHQTFEQFIERRKLKNTVDRLLSAPDPTFHVDQQAT